MDAFAVAFAMGVRSKSFGLRQTLRLAWYFGLFQAVMPVFGWFSALSIRSYIENLDHWIAFGLLAFIGGKMIVEAFQLRENDSQKDPTKGMLIIILSIATSIDALAIGFSLALLHLEVWFPAFVIGVVAFAFTGAGVFLGKRLVQYEFFSSYAEVLGGVILLLIGTKILYEHGVFQWS